MKRIVVVDIDGTISQVGERLKYLKQEPKDWDSFYNDCFEDEPIEEMIDLVYSLYLQGYQLVFCTGRRESCRGKTLTNYGMKSCGLNGITFQTTTK